MQTRVIIKGFLSNSPKNAASTDGTIYLILPVASIRTGIDTKTVDFFDVRIDKEKIKNPYILTKGKGILIFGHLISEKHQTKNFIYNNIKIIADEVQELDVSTPIPDEYINYMSMSGGVQDEIYN